MGALTLATSGAGDKIGATNAVSLALAGSMAGPLGAGAGFAAGAFLDLRAASNDTESAIKSLNAASKSLDIGQMLKAFDRASEARKSAEKQSNIAAFLGPGAGIINEIADPDTSKLDAEESKAKARYASLKTAYLDLSRVVGTPLPKNASNAQIAEFAERARPALEAAGISMSKLASGSVSDLARARDALDGFGLSIADVDKRAAGLSDTLTRVSSPKLDLDAARDQLNQTLRSLSKLTSAGVDPRKQTAAAEVNRNLVRSAFTDTQQMIEKQVQAGASSDKLAATLQRSRKSIIDQGIAAGISRKEMSKYVDGLGLTPRLIETEIRANVREAQGKVNGYLKTLSLTPSQRLTLTKLASSGATGQLKAYVNRLKLTPAQKSTLMKALTAAASGNISDLQRQINSLHDKEVRIEVTRVNTQVNRILGAASIGAPKKASGGWIHGPGGPREDKVPAMLSNGEIVDQRIDQHEDTIGRMQRAGGR